MKKAILITCGTNVTEKEKSIFKNYAHTKDAILCDQIEFQDILPITDTDEIIRDIIRSQAQVVITNDSLLLVSELIHNGTISRELKNNGIEMYCQETDMKISDMINNIPKELKHNLIDLCNKRGSCSGKELKILAILKQNREQELKDYIDNLSNSNRIREIHEIIIDRYDSSIEDILENIIKEHAINEVIIFSNYHSLNFDDFMQKYADCGMKVVYEYSEKRMRNQELHILMH